MVYFGFLGVFRSIVCSLNLTLCFAAIVYGTMSVMLFVWLFVCYFFTFLLLYFVFFFLSVALFQRSVMVYFGFLGVSCFIVCSLNLTLCFAHIAYGTMSGMFLVLLSVCYFFTFLSLYFVFFICF